MRSIRERILKAKMRLPSALTNFSCSEVDPGEDTERPATRFDLHRGQKSCSEVDPGEDTESLPFLSLGWTTVLLQ